MSYFPAPHLLCICLALCPLALVSTAQQGSPANPGLVSNSFRTTDVPTPSVSPPAAKPQISLEMRGDIYMARKMYREAIDTYRQGPESAVLTNKIGIAFHQMMLLKLAKKNYEKAIKMEPEYSEAINNLGTIHYSQKNYRRAISTYKKALKYAPQSASIYSNLGTAYFARRDYKRATESYQQALELDPDIFEHHSSFGTLMLERTVEERAKFHLYLAKMYAKSGASDRALIYLRKALEEGIKEREKIPEMPEFAKLKTDPSFKQLLIQNPKPL